MEGTEKWATNGILEMQGQKWIFMPMGRRPTVGLIRLKLVRELAKLSAVLLMGLLLVPSLRSWWMIGGCIALELLVAYLTLARRYTRKICIDLDKAEMVLFYITIFGKKGLLRISLKWAEVSYRYRTKRGSDIWLLRVSDAQAKMQLYGKIYSERWTFNSFHKQQLDKMSELINTKIVL